MKEHGSKAHQIDQSSFLTLIRQQLTKDLDTNFDPMGIPCTRGVPIKVRLASFGYTLVAKCAPAELASYLKHEAAVYERLKPIQGIHVPVCLGIIDLDRPYRFEGIAVLVHAMFLSYGGTALYRHRNNDIKPHLTQQVERAMQAIHNLNVLHRDPFARNILWNSTSGQVIVIDFERAEILELRPALGIVSLNPKRARVNNIRIDKPAKGDGGIFMDEMNTVRHELRTIMYK